MRLVGGVVAVLFVFRLCHPEVNPRPSVAEGEATAHESVVSVPEPAQLQQRSSQELPPGSNLSPLLDFSYRHPIYSVYSYHGCFPDVQDVQYPAARRHGVRPVRNRDEAEHRKKELLFVGYNPYYEMDPAMRSSIPYLVPRASALLEHISRRFLDSLAVKGVPLHKLIVTSVLRTEEDVAKLRRINGNASEQSCHRFGTTFDISYNRYHTVSPPDEPARRPVRNDSLKFILSEVLRDARAEGRCYVKYEVKQGCFHITVR